jgi:signal transduction histidine kinase
MLVVEDGRTLIRVLQDWLEAAGYTVSVAHDGQDALKLLKTSSFDLATFLSKSCIITSGKKQMLDQFLAGWEDIVRANRDLLARQSELECARTQAEARAGGLETQLQQAQKMEVIGRLAGGIAHDFNNMLTIINGYCEMLLEQLHSDDPRHALVREMAGAGNRAALLTRQLLAFGRKAVVEPKVLNLRDVVSDCERLLRRVIGDDIELETVFAAGPGSVRADPTQLTQVLLNLVLNARDAMSQGGKLTIEVGSVKEDSERPAHCPGVPPGPLVLLAVRDTGHGIAADLLPRIWEPFFTTKAEGKGTGLGLPVVQSVIRQLGGYIRVQSEVGQGSTFEIYLPRAEAPPVPSKSHPAFASLPRGDETILLVENMDAIRFLTRHVLEGCGYTVLEARDGEEALRLVEKRTGGAIHLLVTDVVMPSLGGRELAERLAGTYPHLKVLYCSGHSEDVIVRHGVLPHEGGFLQKPFSAATLAQKVREVLD